MSNSPITQAGRQPQISRPVSSVNIPSRLATPEVPNNIHDRRVAQLPISKNLNAFESTLNSLLSSISKYAPNVADAERLVEVNRELQHSLENIIAHQRAGLDIDSLEAQSARVDKNCKDILIGLGECRKRLSSFPSLEKTLEEEKRMAKTHIQADELLAYAMKLAKFTTAPPTFDSAAIGPNNFIWPGEDMMRRGMLAIASLNKEKILDEAEDEDQDIFNENEILEEHQKREEAMRRSSFGGSYGDNQPKNVEDDDLDLDLFDPDEE